MSRNIHKKRKSGIIKSIVEELANRMIAGETIDIDEATIKYFDPKTLLSTLQAKGKMASIIQRSCKMVESQDKFAGSLGNGVFGIPTNKDQLFRLIASKYYQLTGRSKSAKNCVEWAVETGLLPEGIVQKNLKAYIPRQLAEASN